MAQMTITRPVALGGMSTVFNPTASLPLSPFMQNFIVEPHLLRKRRGYSQMGLNLPLTGTGNALFDYTDAAGTNHLYAATNSQVYEYNASSDMWEVVTPGTVLEDCESGWTAEADVTITYDTSVYVRGSKSAKFTLGASKSDGDKLGYEDFSAVDISAYTNIGFWIRSNTTLAANSLELVVSESANGAKSGTYVECLTTALTADTWTYVTLAKTLTDFNATVSVALYANASLSSGLVIYLDDIQAQTPFTGSDDNLWSGSVVTDTAEFTNNGGTVLALTNDVEDVQFIEGDSGGQLSTMVHAYPNFSSCRCLVEFWNHLMFLSYVDSATRVRNLIYAVSGDIDDWTSFGSGAVLLTDSIGEILNAVKLKYDLVIYSEKTIGLCRYYGSTTIFEFPTVIYQTGLIAQRAVQALDNAHYLIGSDYRPYVYAGGTQIIPVGRNVELDIVDRLDVSKLTKVVAGRDPARLAVYFAIPRSGDSYARAVYAYKFGLVNLPWEYHVFADYVRDFEVFANQYDWYCDDNQFAEVYCDERSFYCDASSGQSGGPITCFITDDGYVMQLDESSGQDDSTDIHAIYHTQVFTVDEEESFFRAQWFSFVAKSIVAGSSVNVSYSIDDGENWTSFEDSPVSLNSDWTTHRLPLSIADRRLMFRIEQNSYGDLQLRGQCKLKVALQSDRD